MTGWVMLFDRLLSSLNVEVQLFTHCVVSSGWQMRLPGPPVPMLHFVLHGFGRISGPRREPAQIGINFVALVPAGCPHSLDTGQVRRIQQIEPPGASETIPPLIVAGSPEHRDLLIACGTVRIGYGRSVGLFDHLDEPLVADLSGAPRAREAICALLEEADTAAPGSKALQSVLMSQCLIYFLRDVHASSGEELPWLRALDDPRLGPAIDTMLKDPGAPHTVDSLAHAAAMSRSAFADHFVQAFGTPPMTFVHHLRMERAASLIRKNQARSIDAVARDVGYSSRSHFSRAYKKHHGVPPMAHRAH